MSLKIVACDSGGWDLDQKKKKKGHTICFKTNLCESTIEKIKEIEGIGPQIITTSAKIFPNTVSYAELSGEMFNDERPYLILFGTGWGLTQEVMDLSYKILEPIRGKTKYNHLSVRSAVSIILDRLIGEK